MKFIHIPIGGMFLIFALMQYNDPDYYIWLPVYSVVSLIAFSTAFGRPQKRIAMLLAFCIAIWMITFIPDLISWIKDGSPNIAGSMKAESPHIELVREMGGLLICLIAVVYYWRMKSDQ